MKKENTTKNIRNYKNNNKKGKKSSQQKMQNKSEVIQERWNIQKDLEEQARNGSKDLKKYEAYDRIKKRNWTKISFKCGEQSNSWILDLAIADFWTGALPCWKAFSPLPNEAVCL